MQLRIITPGSQERTFEVTKVFFPGIDGSFEVLTGHAPLIAALAAGTVRWDDGSEKIGSGFVEVRGNVIKLVAE